MRAILASFACTLFVAGPAAFAQSPDAFDALAGKRASTATMQETTGQGMHQLEDNRLGASNQATPSAAGTEIGSTVVNVGPRSTMESGNVSIGAIQALSSSVRGTIGAAIGNVGNATAGGGLGGAGGAGGSAR